MVPFSEGVGFGEAVTSTGGNPLVGLPGRPGERGPIGEKGQKGDRGEKGPEGKMGKQGLSGAPGARGVRGPTGASGTDPDTKSELISLRNRIVELELAVHELKNFRLDQIYRANKRARAEAS